MATILHLQSPNVRQVIVLFLQSPTFKLCSWQKLVQVTPPACKTIAGKTEVCGEVLCNSPDQHLILIHVGVTTSQCARVQCVMKKCVCCCMHILISPCSCIFFGHIHVFTMKCILYNMYRDPRTVLTTTFVSTYIYHLHRLPQFLID